MPVDPWYTDGMVAEIEGFGDKRDRIAIVRATKRGLTLHKAIQVDLIGVRHRGRVGGISVPVDRIDDLVGALLKVKAVVSGATCGEERGSERE